MKARIARWLRSLADRLQLSPPHRAAYVYRFGADGFADRALIDGFPFERVQPVDIDAVHRARETAARNTGACGDAYDSGPIRIRVREWPRGPGGRFTAAKKPVKRTTKGKR